MDDKLFECGICLEVCHECINCLRCNQIYCRRHVKDLPENRCPSCRDAPFRFQENVALQRIIRDLRERLGLPEPPPSPREEQTTGEGREEQVVPALVPSPPVVLEEGAGYRSQDFLTGPPRGLVLVEQRFGHKVPCRRQDGFQKIPTDEHEDNMRQHVRNCTHEGCHSVWSGPWGKFIGGRSGKTHFELTECRQGKRLNQLIGWNYDDPRQ